MAKIIAELCQNHNGDRELLKRMIHAAAEAGASYAKGQIIFADDLVPRGRFENGETENNGVVKSIKRPFRNEYLRLKGLDLKEEDYVFFVEECKRAGIAPMLTVFNRSRIPFAASLPWSERVVKVASFDCGSFAMIEELTRYFDTLIISTGGTFEEEIGRTAQMVKESGKKLSLLHCVSTYPTTPATCNLARMEHLRRHTSSVGWSDHSKIETDGIKAAKVALMLGADIIERHFTVQEASKTKDGPVSLTPALLRELVKFSTFSKEEQKARVEKEIPDWHVMVGTGRHDITHAEMLNRDYYRGRFASFVSGEWVQNWEEKKAF